MLVSVMECVCAYICVCARSDCVSVFVCVSMCLSEFVNAWLYHICLFLFMCLCVSKYVVFCVTVYVSVFLSVSF